MKIVILDRETLGADLDLRVLEKFGEVKSYPKTLPSETAERVKGQNIILTNKVVINRDILENSSDMKLICITATGMNNVDLKSAEEFGIEVKNVAGYSTESVVQHTFATLFYLLENLNYHNSFVKSGEWRESRLFTDVSKPFFELAGKKFGVIGLGTIGKRVGEVAKAFGCEVVYYSTSGKNSSSDFKRVELNELLSTSSVISVHSPLNPQTENLLNYENMQQIKDGSVILNMGRGGIINEEDIAKTIESREILFGLDVTSVEPLPAENPLNRVLQNGKLFITPHIAWTSIEARKKLLEGVVKNIEDFLK